MKALPLSLTCPRCGSADVVYSCEPECCFNHVCGDCLCSFQLLSRDSGRMLPEFEEASDERDTLSPTVACARCDSLNVFMLEESGVNNIEMVCGQCHALLELEVQS